MTIIFAVLVGLLLIVLGVVLRLYLNERIYHEFAVSAAHHLRLQVKKETEKRDALEREMRVLRNANREANRAWQNERRRLSRPVMDAQPKINTPGNNKFEGAPGIF